MLLRIWTGLQKVKAEAEVCKNARGGRHAYLKSEVWTIALISNQDTMSEEELWLPSRALPMSHSNRRQ